MHPKIGDTVRVKEGTRGTRMGGRAGQLVAMAGKSPVWCSIRFEAERLTLVFCLHEIEEANEAQANQ